MKHIIPNVPFNDILCIYADFTVIAEPLKKLLSRSAHLCCVFS